MFDWLNKLLQPKMGQETEGTIDKEITATTGRVQRPAMAPASVRLAEMRVREQRYASRSSKIMANTTAVSNRKLLTKSPKDTSTDDGFAVSMVIGMATDSGIIGGIVGGNMAGGFTGQAIADASHSASVPDTSPSGSSDFSSSVSGC